jgi:hypothetical protein
MIRTLEDLNRQKEALFQKHPELHQYKCCRISEIGISLDELKGFIWECWQTDYQQGATIVSEPFIEWIIGDGCLHELSSLAILNEHEEVLGVVLGIKREYEWYGTRFPSVLNTGFSVDPQYRGQGICQYLRLSYLDANLRQGYPLTVGWFDSRHNQPGTAHYLYAKKNEAIHADIPFYGKTLDYNMAVRQGQLSTLQKIYLRLSTFIFPLIKKNSLGKHYVEECRECDLQRYLTLLGSSVQQAPLKRVFSERELSRQLFYKQGELETISYCIKQNEKVLGLIYGYKNRVSIDSYVLQLDGVILSAELNYLEKRFFFGCVEGKVYRDRKCFAIIGIRTVFSENPLPYGYLPFSKQTLEVVNNSDQFGITPDCIKRSFLALR